MTEYEIRRVYGDLIADEYDNVLDDDIMSMTNPCYYCARKTECPFVNGRQRGRREYCQMSGNYRYDI